MNAAPQLNLNGLGLDAEQQRSLQQQLAAARNAGEFRGAPPPLFGPGAAPPLPRAVAPVIVQGAGDAPDQGPAPLIVNLRRGGAVVAPEVQELSARQWTPHGRVRGRG